MSYSYSQIDKTNLAWFDKNSSRATLLGLEIVLGQLRGLENLKIQFRYPVTAISGKNGTGKSTILACIACAFHNTPSGFKTLNRKRTYYTFSDFFIQTSEEEPLAYLQVRYDILHDAWRKSERIPSGVGVGSQWQWKLLGRWNNYRSRVNRNVVFCGIERVVPHAEKSVSKSYRRAFQKGQSTGYETAVADTVGRILGRHYDEFYYKQHSKYRLPLVKSKDRLYSGFNMGAGENTLFEIFSIIYACEGSLLLVIDEIELGLHEEAQVRLIRELKELCGTRHIQIVCTTHSPRVIGCLPPQGRVHLERVGNDVRVIEGISPQYAAGLLSGVKDAELDVYCEDDVAKNILASVLPNDIRLRVQITPIGSAAAVVRQLAARYKERSKRAACGLLDGDQTLKKAEYVGVFLGAIETAKDRDDATEWIENRLAFLPGDTRPERWLLQTIRNDISENLTDDFGVAKEVLTGFVEEALSSTDHTELYVMSQRLNLASSAVESRLVRAAIRRSSNEIVTIVSYVRGFLGGG
jgi:predicted ATPase